MAMPYFCCYYDYKARWANLSDSQLGKLLRALMDYGSGCPVPPLRGQVKMAFDFIVYDMDRSEAVYAAKCQKNRENARKKRNDSAGNAAAES